MNKIIYNEDRRIMAVDENNRITYFGRLFHDCGKPCRGFDELRVGPNGTEIIKGNCVPIILLNSCKYA